MSRRKKRTGRKRLVFLSAFYTAWDPRMGSAAHMNLFSGCRRRLPHTPHPPFLLSPRSLHSSSISQFSSWLLNPPWCRVTRRINESSPFLCSCLWISGPPPGLRWEGLALAPVYTDSRPSPWSSHLFGANGMNGTCPACLLIRNKRRAGRLV